MIDYTGHRKGETVCEHRAKGWGVAQCSRNFQIRVTKGLYIRKGRMKTGPYIHSNYSSKSLHIKEQCKRPNAHAVGEAQRSRVTIGPCTLHDHWACLGNEFIMSNFLYRL